MSISWLAVLTLSRLLNRSTSWLSTVESGVDLSLFVRLLEKNKVCRNPSLSSHIPVLDSRQMSLTSGSSASILLSVISSVVSHRKTTSCNFPFTCDGKATSYSPPDANHTATSRPPSPENTLRVEWAHDDCSLGTTNPHEKTEPNSFTFVYC